MKQINHSIIGKACQDREPSDVCILCDNRDRCSSCDARDWGNDDCNGCDYEAEE